MKKLILSLAVIFASVSLTAQEKTVEELKKELSEKQAQIGKLQGEASALQGKIDAFPGWKFGTFGTVGVNFSGFNDWYTNSFANSSSASIGVSFNGFANLDREKFFWRNSLTANLGWLKLDTDTTDDFEPDFENTTDVFALTSLYGYKLNDKWAVSALAEYRTSFSNFNDPGYLDFGVGVTWTPISELVVVIHPLNYNWVFSSGDDASFESSLGAKFVADYNKTIGKFKFRSTLSGFYSYKSSDYSNWTWVNSLGFNVWKGIGVGLEAGLRGNKQEDYNYNYDTSAVDISDIDVDVQSYWLVGLSYGF